MKAGILNPKEYEYIKMLCMKKIIFFEGLKATGKTTMIHRVKSKLHTAYAVEILNKLHPCNASILFSNNPDYVLTKGIYTKSLFRWTRQFLYLNHIHKSKSEIFLIDRGILTTYIHSRLDKIPDFLIEAYMNEMTHELKKYSVKTVFLDCKLETTCGRINSRPNLSDIDKKNQCEVNRRFDREYSMCVNREFNGTVKKFKTSKKLFRDYNKILEFIEN